MLKTVRDTCSVSTFTDLEGMGTRPTYHQMIQIILKDYFSQKYSQQTRVNEVFYLSMHNRTVSSSIFICYIFTTLKMTTKVKKSNRGVSDPVKGHVFTKNFLKKEKRQMFRNRRYCA